METVLVDNPRPGITRITLNRPERLNAMTSELVQALHGALDAVAIDPSCRVVVLTGAGRGFCAGLDLAGFGARAEHRGVRQDRRPASPCSATSPRSSRTCARCPSP